MNFELSEEQIAVRDLAAQIFTGSVTVERVKEIEASEERVDRELWQRARRRESPRHLACPRRTAGAGSGSWRPCLVLQQQGRVVAPVPLLGHGGVAAR